MRRTSPKHNANTARRPRDGQGTTSAPVAQRAGPVRARLVHAPAALAVALALCGLAAQPGAAQAQAAGDSEAALKRLQVQVAEQRALIEAQQRQIDRLTRLIESLPGAGAPGAATAQTADGARAAAASPAQTTAPGVPSSGAPVAATAGTAGTTAAAASAPSSAPPVAGRFDGVSITLGGAVRTTVLSSSARAQPDGTPFFLLPRVSGDQGSTKFDARSSNLALGIEGLSYGGYRFGAQMIFQMSNGDLLSGGYGVTPYVAFVEARNETTRFAMGLQEDVFSPRIPKMVDSVSALAASGNPGNSSRAQLRAEHTVGLGAGERITLVGALSDSLPQTVEPGFAKITENTGWPNIEARLAWTRGAPDAAAWVPWAASEFGLSGVTGRFRTVFPSGARSAFDTRFWGVALDGRLRLGPRAGVQGELYSGRSLGPYLGAILQTVNASTGRAIASHGGWGELVWYWSPALHSHAGYGIDRARSGDLPAGGLLRNRTVFANAIWDISRMTQISIEGTWRRTDYLGLPANSGVGLMLGSELRF